MVKFTNSQDNSTSFDIKRRNPEDAAGRSRVAIFGSFAMLNLFCENNFNKNLTKLRFIYKK